VLKVYLAGPINGCSDEECRAWRAEARRMLEPIHSVIDPMDFDCRGLESQMAGEIIRHDLERLDEADIVLVNAERPSWGTAMELVYARQGGKPAIAFAGFSIGGDSPWLLGHVSKVFLTLTEACSGIASYSPDLGTGGNQCL
jgi:nucleoside 2-deoxyribosyltransferase